MSILILSKEVDMHLNFSLKKTKKNSDFDMVTPETTNTVSLNKGGNNSLLCNKTYQSSLDLSQCYITHITPLIQNVTFVTAGSN